MLDSAVFHISLRTIKTLLLTLPPFQNQRKSHWKRETKKTKNDVHLNGKFWVQFFHLKGSCLYKNHFHIFSRLASWSCKCSGIACNDRAIKLVSCLLKTIMIYIYIFQSTRFLSIMWHWCCFQGKIKLKPLPFGNFICHHSNSRECLLM